MVGVAMLDAQHIHPYTPSFQPRDDLQQQGLPAQLDGIVS